ncbi:hypothetical protein BFP72_03605 [Reichenbachiella sp. 5M10]|uniref:hypothetical protein n=1 Tax=Reichenbachiella sp. 5M10 TaxID=1889772 RepID=UPI000C160731|nr:hypothetical protein [Reichenbachiella sp. 5M10]PIB34559.1 hypothetical protein BFP72_03605 [Reichenbachiella sp. 5M10]
MKNILNSAFLVLLTGLVISCGSKKEAPTEKVTTANVKEVVKREFDYPIPTSFEVTTVLQDAGAAFVLNVTNPVENVDKYETQRAKALNLGIYGADLSYASTYNMNTETMALFKASKKLIDGLDVPGVFNEKMVSRVQQNIDNQDSLILIITESFYNTYEQLNQTGQDKISFLVVTASWIEGLYITTQLTVSSNYDKRLMAIVAEQKKSAQILTEAAAKYADDEDIQSIMPLLNFMQLTYDGIDPAVGITKGQLDDIMENVESTRNEITG